MQIMLLYSVCVGCDKGKYIVGVAVCGGICPYCVATLEDRVSVCKLYAAALDLCLRLLNLKANAADVFFGGPCCFARLGKKTDPVLLPTWSPMNLRRNWNQARSSKVSC